MELIAKYQKKEVWLYNYVQDDDLSVDFGNSPFVCMLWNNREDFVSPALIEQLLKQNCKYFVAGGENCEEWHDCADEVQIDEHVVTTWHKGQSLEEVVYFALNSTDFGNYEFDRFLFVQVGKKFSMDELRGIIEKSWS